MKEDIPGKQVDDDDETLECIYVCEPGTAMFGWLGFEICDGTENDDDVYSE